MKRFVVIAGFGVLLAGCYSLQPAAGVVPESGTNVAFDINDAGRVALGGSMGPAILQIAGQLVSKDSEEYLVAVKEVELLQGGNQVWAGEQVRIKTSYVSTVYLRRFSPARTVAFTAASLGAIAIFAGKSLANSFIGPDQPDTNVSASSRGRRPVRKIEYAPLLRRPNPPRSH